MNDNSKSNGKTENTEGKFNTERAEFFEALGHPTRIKILEVLADGSKSFSNLKKELEIESSGNLSFHLGKLTELVKTDSSGDYVLTDDGKEAVRVIETSMQTESTKQGGRRKHFGMDPVPIAVSIVWAFTMVAVSLLVRGDTVVGSEILEILIFGFIASLVIVTGIGQSYRFRNKK